MRKRWNAKKDTKCGSSQNLPSDGLACGEVFNNLVSAKPCVLDENIGQLHFIIK